MAGTAELTSIKKTLILLTNYKTIVGQGVERSYGLASTLLGLAPTRYSAQNKVPGPSSVVVEGKTDLSKDAPLRYEAVIAFPRPQNLSTSKTQNKSV